MFFYLLKLPLSFASENESGILLPFIDKSSKISSIY